MDKILGCVSWINKHSTLPELYKAAYRIYPYYQNRNWRTKYIEIDQTASKEGLHCLSLIQQFLYKSAVSQMGLFFFVFF